MLREFPVHKTVHVNHAALCIALRIYILQINPDHIILGKHHLDLQSEIGMLDELLRKGALQGFPSLVDARIMLVTQP